MIGIFRKKLPLQLFLFSLSYLIVGFAQPDWSALGCILASCIGYALFWKGMLLFPTKKGRFFSATVWFALVEALHLNWFFADRYVGAYIYLFLPLLFLSLGTQFGLISLFIKNPKEMGLVRILGICGGWALLEWSRLFFLSGYSWDPVGLALSGTNIGLQFVSVVGVYGLSFWIFFTNLLALRFLALPAFSQLPLWVGVMSIPYLFGSIHLAVHGRRLSSDSTPPLAALLVQTALSPEDKMPLEGSRPFSPFDQWEQIVQMLAPYRLQENDLIVFSEAVVPYGTNVPIYRAEYVKNSFDVLLGFSDFLPAIETELIGNRYWAQGIANAFGSDVVIGLEDADFNPSDNTYKVYNAAFLFRPFSQIWERYEKRVLVPMGEYVPFRWCRKILLEYGIADSYMAGKEAKVFQTKRTPISMSICYEETFGRLMRQCRSNGAELMINLTNDVWYPRSRLPLMHFYHGKLRAVECGVPLLRSCNTGVTCGVDALGRVVAMLDYDCRGNQCPAGVLSLGLPLYHYPTFYTIFGDRLVIYCSLLLFGWMFILEAAKKKMFTIKSLGISLLRKN